MRVEVDNLKRHFGKTKAVDGISFSFGSGQIFGFIGPNGAGKTTTMRILATLDDPTAGDIRVDSVSITERPERARELIGFMPDALPRHRDVNVHDYLDFFARAYRIRGKKRHEVVEQIEAFTNLTNIRDKPLNALSKGMAQRVSLARALVHDPPLLVLDEPAAGLDPRARVELRELLRVLGQQGKAILISSHILSELAEICDGAAIIERGSIVGAGTIDQLVHGDGDPVIKLHIRALCEPEKLLKAVLELPNIDKAHVAGTLVEAQITGDEETACDLLASLIGRGFRITEFKQHRAQLEEIFINMTKGEVA